jgi:hypothetical protein
MTAQRTGTPRIVRVGPSSVKSAPYGRVAHGDGRKRPPLTPEPLPTQRA